MKNILQTNLKVIVTILMVLNIYFISLAQDIIVLHSGDLIKANVLEINQNEIKYKKISNPNGPTFSIAKTEVLSISYENGEKDTFEPHPQPNGFSTPSKKPTPIAPIVASNNQGIIAYYNSPVLSHKKHSPSKKLTNYAIVNLGITPQSTMSDQNIEISFELNDTWNEILDWCWGQPAKFGRCSYHYNYKVSIKNKTNEFLYIDTESSFRISPDGEAVSFYSNISTSHTEGSLKEGSLNVGAFTNVLGIGGVIGTLADGLNVGNSSTSSTSITEFEQRILVVPPQSKVYMPQKVYVNSTKTKSTKNYELIDITCIKSHPKIEKWAYLDLEDKYINYSSQFVITYSRQKDFMSYTSLSIGVYPRGLLGTGQLSCTTNYNDFISDKTPIMIGGEIKINQ